MNRVPFFELSVFEGRLFVGGTKIVHSSSWELKNFQLADLGAVASSFSFLIPFLSVPINTTSNSVLH